MRPILRFGARFFLVWIASQLLIAFVPAIEGLALAGTASNVLAVLRAVGVRADVVGTAVVSAHTRMEIIPDCTPLVPTALLWSAMLAFPAAAVWKGIGLVVSAALLWIYNVGRVVALWGVLHRWPSAFEPVHSYLWQPVSLMVVAALLLLWLRIEPGRAPP